MDKKITGDYYRHKNTPYSGWAKILEIIKPHTGLNTHAYPIAKCEWAIDKYATFGLIKYFKVTDLIKEV